MSRYREKTPPLDTLGGLEPLNLVDTPGKIDGAEASKYNFLIEEDTLC